MLTTVKKKSPARERILDAALKLFSERGYIGTTTREAAKEAGVSEVTLFRHFGSKEELFKEVIDTYSLLPALKGILPALDGMSYEEALKAIARKFFETVYERKDFIKIMFSEVHLYPEAVKRIHKNFRSEITRILAAYLREEQKGRALRADFDPELASSAFFGMFFAFFISREFFRLKAETSLDAVIEEFVEIFAGGTKKR